MRAETTTRLSVKVVPGASRSGIAGWLGDTVKIRVSAPPERGRANAAVEELLAKTLGLPAGSARVIKGQTSARKVVEIVGLCESEVRERLSKDGG